MLYGSSPSGSDRRRTWNTSIPLRELHVQKYFWQAKREVLKPALYLQDWGLQQCTNSLQTEHSSLRVRLVMHLKATKDLRLVSRYFLPSQV